MEIESSKKQSGAPAWMATFADLATLLMCFFVLLLSFSEMDVLKFKQIAGSMKNAFGVQNLLDINDISKGTSVIAQEFRPGRPEPTPIEVIMQQTIDMTQRTLDFHEGESDRAGGAERSAGTLTGGQADKKNKTQQQDQDQNASDSLKQLEKLLNKAIEREIEEGNVEIENFGQQLVIRIKEQGAFPEGSAFLQPKFRPRVRQVASLVKDVPGTVRITGHTDNRPVESELYRSNWDISAQRAVSVAQEMAKVTGFDQHRMQVMGLADTAPIASNDTAEGRKRNRRVEISIMQGKPYYSDPISVDSAPPIATEHAQ
ncbi:putative lipoprotein YiaD precursor [Photobacterium damselae subsp. piscicida]|uniref:Flagellar motor protein MotB n=1 Tax=Photobacterium damsela subsp. piscicida TaxID=38294 RepID=A0A1V1V970_PHODP|nr:flagellar motor protein MotB [Photobacterium damselae]MBE8129880.1 flagellar motor protein MotB [Photobacterium damselae subsp. piscicida]PSV76098.1 flagellar motor protein MotB [Photobacterium damselae]PSW79695.1 flagellar motor protein MotB [Photobacterium damselae]QOD52074.1 flagellar motor protein MotB [Photobacterium damselae subsp. piscicida]QOD55927.1 flagellar motor protein MotB [Photobacterium damselae subsp. piscicida]